MRNYLIIILVFLDLILIKFINSKQIKFNKGVINFMLVIQLLFIFWILYTDNNLFLLTLIDDIKNRFIEIFLYAHKTIPNNLKP